MLYVSIIIQVILLVTGSAGNLFILVVQFLDWLKSDQLGPVDLIIISIAFVNLLLQGSFAFNEICLLLFLDFYVQIEVTNSLIAIITSLAFSSLLCSTTLCFYYYVKIININRTIFYKLKTKLPVIVPWLLVFSIVISWTTGLPAYWDIYRESQLPTDNVTYVPSTYHLNYKSRSHCLFPACVLLSAMAFAIILFTTGSIIKSLYKHMTQIKKSNEDLRHTRLSAHISAARTLLSLLILYLIFYGMLNIIFNEAQDIGSVLFFASFMVVSSFPTGNALILIFGNKKLSNKLRYILGIKEISEKTVISVNT